MRASSLFLVGLVVLAGCGDDATKPITAEQFAIETGARVTGDTNLQTAIDAEAQARRTTDSTLQSQIDTEVAARKQLAADAMRYTDDAVSMEATDRKATDVALQAQVDQLKGSKLVSSHLFVKGLNGNPDGPDLGRSNWADVATAMVNGEEVQIAHATQIFYVRYDKPDCQNGGGVPYIVVSAVRPSTATVVPLDSIRYISPHKTLLRPTGEPTSYMRVS